MNKLLPRKGLFSIFIQC